MAKLYPPYIEGTIPAFFKSDDDGTAMITVPLSMNKAVGEREVKGFKLKIKTAQTGILLGDFDSERFELKTEMAAWFNLTSIANKLTVGQYYKIQIAYVGMDDVVGYYSTVGVAKYTTMPDIAIDGLEFKVINTHQYRYLGTYSQKNKDITERVYSYRFDIYDINRNIIATSGDLLHNRNNDINNYESQDEWVYQKDLDIDTPYYIQYTVKTLNNLTIATSGYRIMQKKTVDPEAPLALVADLNFDNGFVDISLKGFKNEDTGLEEPVVGSFVILRASDDEGFANWSEVLRFNLSSVIPSRWLWRDYTVEQGRTYLYALQQYNDYGLYSNKILSNEVFADFEDAFLFDGKKQLRIRYNPKISSFKNTIYETKVDTIGGKHPFIFRNGVTNYKEFPISGMISYFMDEDELFIPKDEYGLINKTTNLTGDNIAAEREFKLKVLEWLNNGEPKLFRSPAEGNYIVRLLNVSLTPQDPVGRMLHTFNATAYEIAEHNFNNLASMKIIDVDLPDLNMLQWQTMNFFEEQLDGTIKYVAHGNPYVNSDETQNVYIDGKLFSLDAKKNLLRVSAESYLIAKTVVFQDMMPGDRILIVQDNNYHLIPEAQIFTIGATGAYQVESPIGITGIYLIDDKNPYGSLLLSYYSRMQNVFNLYTNVEISEVPVRRFVGLQKESYTKNKDGLITDVKVSNIVDLIQNVKVELMQFYDLDFLKRPLEKIYIKKDGDGKYYSDIRCQYEVKNDNYSYELINNINLTVIDYYYVYEVNEVEFDNESQNIKKITPIYYLDGSDGEKYALDLYDTKFYINDNPEVDVYQTNGIHIDNFGEIQSIHIGLGVMLNAAYQIRTITYNLEVDPTIPLSNPQLLEDLHNTGRLLKEEQEKLNQLNIQLENKEITLEEYIPEEDKLNNNIKVLYAEYIDLLDYTLKLYKEDNAITV